MYRTLMKWAVLSCLIPAVANAEQVIKLHKGWNLIGISEKAPNMRVDSIIKGKPIELIVTNINGAWKKYDPNKSYLQQFKEFDPGRGYWVKAKNDTEIELQGTPASLPTLLAGWNLVAFSSKSQVDSLLNHLLGLGYKTELIVTNINGAWKKYDPNKSYLQQFKKFDPNLGYWVKVLKKVEETEIGGTGKKLIVYTDKELSGGNKKQMTIKVAEYKVEVNVPADATKLELRIEDESGKEIAGGIVVSQNNIQNGSYEIPGNVVSNLEQVTSIAYYVLSANPSGVPQPLSGVTVKDENGSVLGMTDADGIVHIDVGKVTNGEKLEFEKDGYTIAEAVVNTNKVVNYVFMSPAETVSGDELESESESGTGRVVGRVLKDLKKYYVVKSSVGGKAVGIVEVGYEI